MLLMCEQRENGLRRLTDGLTVVRLRTVYGLHVSAAEIFLPDCL